MQTNTAVSPRIAIIGSGPAGFYTAERLLKESSLTVSVDMFEKLPAPFGLVRYGVAPDHQKIKSVVKKYEKIAAHPRFRFFGNVEIGSQLSIETLRRHYHQIVYAVGAQSDRAFPVTGFDGSGCHSATEFVAWYNGHPDYKDCTFDLTQKHVAIVGMGNVALDVARILTRTPEELAQTDIAEHALEALSKSNVTDVYLLGRRGVAQAAFSPAEAKELGEMADVDVAVCPSNVTVCPDFLAGADRQTKRNVATVQGYAKRPFSQAKKRIHLRFLVSPVGASRDRNGRLRSICLAKNELVENEKGQIKPRATGEEAPLPVGLLFTSIGYRGVPLDGVPFDDWSGTFCNENGRILNPLTQTTKVGEYTAGWIKRGPTGVIGTNRACAIETAEQMIADCHDGVLLLPQYASPDAALTMVQTAQPRFVSFDDWQYLDAQEQMMGQINGRSRIKYTDREAMLQAIENRS